ncbi:hypothetical protein [Sphingomonas elodea]|uniref:hypothetical protein n=1 Tax=Sphingomonas elodea TaxID=179878 RepID=UPI00026321F0|nr:hypothetical protein [Sphingomonas elodea]
MRRRAQQAPLCHVTGCSNPRLRLGVLCTRCAARLPAEIRLAIGEAHHQRRWHDHAAACRQAGTFLNLPAPKVAPAPTNPSVSPQRAYELQARMLGERNDA